MKANIIDISPPIPYLGKLFSSYGGKCSSNQIAGFFKMLYLKKEVNDEVYFWHADKHRTLLQVDT